MIGMNFIRRRLSVKLAVLLALLALPLLTLGGAIVIRNERASVEMDTIREGQVAAIAGARAVASILESGLDSGALTEKDVLDPDYQEIKYSFPIEDKRYNTKIGDYTDAHHVQEIEDEILASGPFIFASLMDKHMYVPTPHAKYDHPPTGDFKHDRAVSRGKRMYDQPEQSAAVGYMGKDPTFVQPYYRDTGDFVWDVAAPIYLNIPTTLPASPGQVAKTVKVRKHWGAFRVGVLRDRIAVRAAELTRSLAEILGGTIFLLALVMFYGAHHALKPLRELVAIAINVSTSYDGPALQTKIKATTQDEIGDLYSAIDRLRESLRAAMARVPYR